jgi:hypothetical protein
MHARALSRLVCVCVCVCERERERERERRWTLALALTRPWPSLRPVLSIYVLPLSRSLSCPSLYRVVKNADSAQYRAYARAQHYTCSVYTSIIVHIYEIIVHIYVTLRATAGVGPALPQLGQGRRPGPGRHPPLPPGLHRRPDPRRPAPVSRPVADLTSWSGRNHWAGPACSNAARPPATTHGVKWARPAVGVSWRRKEE